MGDEAGMGNVPISGIAPGPANAGGMNNVTVDPSGIGNASKITPLPSPRITVPAIPRFKCSADLQESLAHPRFQAISARGDE
jgi:hypothetical protein